MIEPTFMFRAKKIWTLQLRIGLIAEEGVTFEDVYSNGAPPFVVLYSAGGYFPLKRRAYNSY